MNNPTSATTLRFNMNDYLIELDVKNHRWTWSKWEYLVVPGQKKQVVCHRGGLEFMKMYPTLVSGGDQMPTATISSREELEVTLAKKGIEYIFLYQGETILGKNFQTVAEAESFHRLEQCRAWTLTDYWYAFDRKINSWCMYEVFTGQLEFTPASSERRIRKQQAADLNKYSRDLHAAGPVSLMTH